MAQGLASARSFVIFRIGEEEYGVPVESVSGIIRYETPTPVPRSPESVIGVVNLRGAVIPVVDLRHRFHREPFEPLPSSRILVADGSHGTFGIAVDSANEVAKIEVESIREVPDGILSAETSKAFTGVVDRNGSLVILLELDEAVPHPDFVSTGEGAALEGEVDV